MDLGVDPNSERRFINLLTIRLPPDFSALYRTIQDFLAHLQPYKAIARVKGRHSAKGNDSIRAFVGGISAVLLVLLGMDTISPAWAQVAVPTVSCSGELSPGPTSLPQNNQIMVELPSSVATELDMFIFRHGMLLGPHGWTCRTHVEVSALIISLAPPDNKEFSPGITEVFAVGNSGGPAQGNMYLFGNAYFPDEVPSGDADRYGPITTSAVNKYKTDILQFSSHSLMNYTTPKNHFGFGDEVLFWFGYKSPTSQDRTIDLPIQGFLKMPTWPDGTAKLAYLFAIALPAKLSKLVPYIQSYALECIDD